MAIDNLEIQRTSDDEFKLVEVDDQGNESKATANAGAINTDQLNNVRYPDPSDDVAGIQSAVDDLPSSGGTVILQEGTYTTDTAVGDGSTYDDSVALLIDKPITLAGVGWQAEIKLKDNSTNGTDGARLIDVKSPDVVLRDFTIDGNRQNGNNPSSGNADGHNICIGRQDLNAKVADASNCLIANVNSINATGDGAEVLGDRNTIVGSHFDQCWEQAFHIRDCKGTRAIGNMARGDVNNGVLHFWSFDGNTVEDCIVANNVFINGRNEGVIIDPGQGGMDGLIFANNVVSSPKEKGVIVFAQGSTDGVPTNVLIKDNIIKSPGHNGIELQYGERVRVKGNSIDGANRNGISVWLNSGNLYDCRVTDNDIYNSNQDNGSFDGIRIDPASNSITDLDIENNVIKTQSGEPSMDNAVDVRTGTISGLEVIRNRMEGMSGSAISGSSRIDTLERNRGWTTENGGEATFSGDGVATSFTIAHGLDETPTIYPVIMVSESSNGEDINTVSAGGTNITVNFSAAPASGTDNVKVTWRAAVR